MAKSFDEIKERINLTLDFHGRYILETSNSKALERIYWRNYNLALSHIKELYEENDRLKKQLETKQ